MEDDEIEMQLDRIVDQAWEGVLHFKLAWLVKTMLSAYPQWSTTRTAVR